MGLADLAPYGRNVHDTPPPTLPHSRQNCLAKHQWCDYIDLLNLKEILGGNLIERLVLVDAGIVDQNIHP
jgi:hypothetical protein